MAGLGAPACARFLVAWAARRPGGELRGGGWPRSPGLDSAWLGFFSVDEAWQETRLSWGLHRLWCRWCRFWPGAAVGVLLMEAVAKPNLQAACDRRYWIV